MKEALLTGNFGSYGNTRLWISTEKIWPLIFPITVWKIYAAAKNQAPQSKISGAGGGGYDILLRVTAGTL